jgi:hypothetical protein
MFSRVIGYNSQRDNIDFGSFPGYKQCFTTVSWMFMSFYTSRIDATDDKKLAIYFDDVEDSVGTQQGIGEKIKRKFQWITGNTSYWWLVQRAGIEKWLWGKGVQGNAIFEEKMPFDDLCDLIYHGPVILQTKKMGGLSGGHIILVVAYDKNNIICHDPYGNALTNYRIRDGAYVEYPKFWLKHYTKEYVTCMYWKGWD